MTTPAQINRELKKIGIDGQIVRSRAGYYYFIGSLLGHVPSIWAHNLGAYTTQEIIKHVKDNHDI